MASKYGAQAYGKDLYSSSVAELQGTLTIPVLPQTARLVRNRALAGSVGALSVVLQGKLTDSRPFQGTVNVVTTFSGKLYRRPGLVGSIDIAPGIFGDLFRAGNRDFDGTLSITPVIRGIMGVTWRIKSANLPIVFTLGGGADTYLGPFWKPDSPVSGPWVPDVPINEFWIPIPVGG